MPATYLEPLYGSEDASVRKLDPGEGNKCLCSCNNWEDGGVAWRGEGRSLYGWSLHGGKERGLHGGEVMRLDLSMCPCIGM